MNSGQRFVCIDCFDDSGIRDFIENDPVSKECSFCHNKYDIPKAVPLSDVAEHIKSCLYEEYDDAANHLSWESAEGGYFGDHWDTYELLVDKIGLELPNDVDNLLLDELLRRLPDLVWCERDPYGANDQEMAQDNWERFRDIVMHQRRFFFDQPVEDSEQDELLSPAEMLEQIFDYAEKLELFVHLDSGTKLFRARYQKPGEGLRTAQDLGPPLSEHAVQSNRMSPPGIVMFYASDNDETALRETASAPGTFVVGAFETRREALLLDLSNLPQVPSLFQEIPDYLEYNPRRVMIFLRQIAGEISQPIARDDRVHVTYVPTQVVTEYVRSRLFHDQQSVDGIIYLSSVHDGGKSYVIFAARDNLLPKPKNYPEGSYPVPEDRWLELTGYHVHSLTDQDFEWRK